MDNFADFIDFITIDEALVTFGNKAYPKFGQVVIIGGGAGSGKGFILNQLLGIDGKVLDVDALKSRVIDSTKMAADILKKTGKNIKDMDMKNPENTRAMHELLAFNLGITKKFEKMVLGAALTAPIDRKPNLIFDVTLQDIAKLQHLSDNMQKLGYKKECIHIVWVINDVDVAWKQNLNRERVVPEDIFMNTHGGAAYTMKTLTSDGEAARKYMDGDFWVVFNKSRVDSNYIMGEKRKDAQTQVGKRTLSPAFIQGNKKHDAILNPDEKPFITTKPVMVKIKQQGKALQTDLIMADNILSKIKEYVPSGKGWG